MRGRERRRVIEAIADHENAAALRLQRFDRRDLAGRLEAVQPCEAERGRDRRDRRAVARQDQNVEAELRQRLPTIAASGRVSAVSRGSPARRCVKAITDGPGSRRASVRCDTTELALPRRASAPR